MGFLGVNWDKVGNWAANVGTGVVDGARAIGSIPMTYVGKPVAEVLGLTADEQDYVGKRLGGLDDLRPGDILVKYRDSSTSNVLIWQAQKNYLPIKYPAWFVHAAMVGGKKPERIDGKTHDIYHTVEMDGHGLVSNSLLTTNGAYAYEVFRCRDESIRKEAAKRLGELMEGTKERPVVYGAMEWWKTKYGMDRMVTKEEFEAGYRNLLRRPDAETFYCSQFVAWLYQGSMYAAGKNRNLFDCRDVHIHPPRLMRAMKFDCNDVWEHVGSLSPRR
jgi:hypothetical protein